MENNLHTELPTELPADATEVQEYVDMVQIKAVQEAQAQAQLAQAKAEAAQWRAKCALYELYLNHGLKIGDELSPESGLITRKK